jgi:hypothetical protein
LIFFSSLKTTLERCITSSRRISLARSRNSQIGPDSNLGCKNLLLVGPPAQI